MAKPKATQRYRSASSGQYVTRRYAERHKSTTVKETDKAKKGKK